jgi:acetate kinase
MSTIEVVHINATRSRSRSTTTPLIPISISARHVHLSQGDFEALFGPGRKMSIRTNLTQPGQFACNEQVTLVGPRNSIERVRILGPARSESQVEISKTDALKLGLDVPVRASGDTEGSPGGTLVGPYGKVELTRGIIVAARHIHMSPDDATRFNVKDKDVVGVRVASPVRTLVFENVLVRVHPDFRLDMHIDTDESNSAGIGVGANGSIVSIT